MDAWKKLLYLRQPYPDNYTDVSFLDQLKRNTTVAKYSYSKLFQDFSLIAFYSSLLLLVNVHFTGIYTHIWLAYLPTFMSTVLSLICLVADTKLGSSHQFKAYVVISVFLLLVSPVLRSLTESTSLDSIWAVSTILTVLNIVYHDYSLDVTGNYRSIMSSNMSFANGIVLASRLLSSTQVFSFLVFSIEVSILAPLFDFRLRQFLATGHYILALCVCSLVGWALYLAYGPGFVVVYLLGVIFVLVVLPLYFAYLQRYKNELQGPWDTAKPKIRVA